MFQSALQPTVSITALFLSVICFPWWKAPKNLNAGQKI